MNCDKCPQKALATLSKDGKSFELCQECYSKMNGYPVFIETKTPAWLRKLIKEKSSIQR